MQRRDNFHVECEQTGYQHDLLLTGHDCSVEGDRSGTVPTVPSTTCLSHIYQNNKIL